MSRLPDIQLDDRRFQDLVSEARLRINRSCPEWTEHNVSDPGITLIELFAWMTEMTIYRLNRVPDKLHVALMELLGIRLDGPTGAHTNLRFRLSAPADRSIDIPGGDSEVGTRRTATAPRDAAARRWCWAGCRDRGATRPTWIGSSVCGRRGCSPPAAPSGSAIGGCTGSGGSPASARRCGSMGRR